MIGRFADWLNSRRWFVHWLMAAEWYLLVSFVADVVIPK
jgi:hypothetical protein